MQLRHHRTCNTITGDVLRSDDLSCDHRTCLTIPRDGLRSQDMFCVHRSALRLQATACGHKTSLDHRTRQASTRSAVRTLNIFAIARSADTSCELMMYSCHADSGCTFDYRTWPSITGSVLRSSEMFFDRKTRLQSTGHQSCDYRTYLGIALLAMTGHVFRSQNSSAISRMSFQLRDTFCDN